MPFEVITSRAPTFGAQPLPNVDDSSLTGAAVAKLGTAMGGFAEQLSRAQDQLQHSTAVTDYLTKSEAIRDKYRNDPEPATAPQRARDELQTTLNETLGSVSNPTIRAQTGAMLTRQLISSHAEVSQTALIAQKHTDTASWEQQSAILGQQWANANSDVQRAAIRDSVARLVDGSRGAGWVDAGQAQLRLRAWDVSSENARADRLVNTDPGLAMRVLNEPGTFPALDPTTLEGKKRSAQAAWDNRNQQNAQDTTKRDPALGAILYGRVTTPAQVDAVFERGLIPQESGGRAAAVSPAGALGIAQLMPDTARGMARKLGLSDVAGLSESALADRLKSDPDLNQRLGKAYLKEGLDAYGGNLWGALARYNAGPGNAKDPRADAWHREAVDKFGPNYSAGQLASIVPFGETKGYVLKIASRLGVDPNAPAPSFAGSHAAAAAVDAEIASQQAASLKIQRAVAEADKGESDAYLANRRLGSAADPALEQRIKGPLIQAAALGDAEATKRLREYALVDELAPVARTAWQMRPADLAAVSTAEEQRRRLGTGFGERDARRLDTVNEVLAVQSRDIDKDKVGMGEKAGLYTATAIPVNADVRSPEFKAALGYREGNALAAQNHFGGNLNVFRPDEKAAIKARYDGASPEEKIAMLGAIAGALGGRAGQAAVKELVGDTPTGRFAAGLWGEDPEVAGSLLKGAAAAEAEKGFSPAKGVNIKTYTAEKATALPSGMFAVAMRGGESGPYADMAQAIDARYAFLSARAGDASGNVDTARLKQAATDVTGGILSQNGRPVIAPRRGMSQREFDGVMWGLKDADVAGVTTGDGTPVPLDYVRGSGKLHAVGDGRYVVQVNRDDGDPKYAQKDGRPWELDLRGRESVKLPVTLAAGAVGASP